MWAIGKRIVLFVLVNALILLSVSVAFTILTTVLGVQITPDMGMVIYYALIGFGGALVGLALSRQMAKWTLGVQVIDPTTHNPAERRLVEMVHNLATKARLPAMPEVGIYESDELNAFATGPTKARSLVAVSTGLLNNMSDDAIEGVLGHEVTHIANGDMVTMTLLQGLINTMVLIAARIIASVIASSVEERSRGTVRLLAFYLIQFVLSILGSMVVCYFSRRREYRADAGGARLAGRERMISGLRTLRNRYEPGYDESQQALASLKISGPSTSALAMLFATHPPLDERIRRLETSAL